MECKNCKYFVDGKCTYQEWICWVRYDFKTGTGRGIIGCKYGIWRDENGGNNKGTGEKD